VLVCSTIKFHGAKDLLTFISNSIIILILKPPQIRGGNNIERAVVPETSFRHGHPIREDGALIKNSIPVKIDQLPYETGQLALNGFPGRQVAPIAFRHVQTSTII
jgi:hypothetical protein